jgi:hypothetical protein
VSTVYWRVERLGRDGVWKQISPEGMGSHHFNQGFFVDKRDAMKRGRIRLVSSEGTVTMEHTAS